MADDFPPPPVEETDVLFEETDQDMRLRVDTESTLLKVHDSEWTAAVKAAALFNQQVLFDRRLRGPLYRDPHSNSIQHVDSFCVHSVPVLTDQQRFSKRAEEIEKLRRYMQREFGMDWNEIMEQVQPTGVDLKNWAKELSESETVVSSLVPPSSPSSGPSLSSIASPPPPGHKSSSGFPAHSPRTREKTYSGDFISVAFKEGKPRSAASSSTSSSAVGSPTFSGEVHSPAPRTKSSRSSSVSSSGFPADACQMCGEQVSNCPPQALQGTRKFEPLEVDPLIRCNQCKRLFHAFQCLQLPRDTLETIRKRTQEKTKQRVIFPSVPKAVRLKWSCVECKSCAVCLETTDDDKLLFCDQCDQGFHTFCLQTPLEKLPPGRWACETCVHCKACGTKNPGSSWKNGYSFCAGCSKLLDRSKNCPICLKDLPTSDADIQNIEVIKCKQCRWILHAECESLTKMSGKQRQQYVCSLCKRSSKSSNRGPKHEALSIPSDNEAEEDEEEEEEEEEEQELQIQEETEPSPSKRGSRSRSSSGPPRKRHRH